MIMGLVYRYSFIEYSWPSVFYLRSNRNIIESRPMCKNYAELVLRFGDLQFLPENHSVRLAKISMKYLY